MIALWNLLNPGPWGACNLQKIAWLLSIIASGLREINISLYNFLQLSFQDVAKIIKSSFFLTLMVKMMGEAYPQVRLINECLWYFLVKLSSLL